MRIKTQELTGAALDWAVAKALGYKATVVTGQQRYDRLDPEDKADRAYSDLIRNSKPRVYWDNPTKHTPCPSFSESWEAGGPIIERELNNLFKHNQLDKALPPVWCAVKHVPSEHGTALLNVDGPTPLIAAMRCFTASRLGDEIDIPEEVK